MIYDRDGSLWARPGAGAPVRASKLRALHEGCATHILAVALFLGCGTQAVAQVNRERPGLVERVWNAYDDAGIARASSAASERAGCSTIMIGPAIALSAGHCGQSPYTTFHMYPRLDKIAWERYGMRQLLHTFRDTDLVLNYVEPGCLNEGCDHVGYAGDKFGYVDFDLAFEPSGSVNYAQSRAKLANGTQLYSVWQNPVTALGGFTHMLISPGMITSNALTSWFTPAVRAADRCHNTGSSRPLGVTSDLWGQTGASGSSTLGAASHRLLLGPLSTALNDAPYRAQLPIVDYLRYGFADYALRDPGCNEDFLPAVNEYLLQELGVNEWTSFYGAVDKNDDGVFDVQNAIERALGETTREVYWLGFESNRRNRLWTASRSTRFDVDRGRAEIDTRGIRTPREAVLSHERLNLKPNTRYTLIYAATLSERGTNPRPLNVVVTQPDGGSSVHIINFDRDRPWFVVPFENEGGGTSIAFDAAQGVRASIMSVAIVEDGALLDFDMADGRSVWTDAGNGLALIWPTGRPADPTARDVEARPEWSGVARRKPGDGASELFSLKTSIVAAERSEETRACFWTRQSGRGDFAPTVKALARWTSQLREIVASRVVFDPEATNWKQHCTPWVPASGGGMRLEFGTVSTRPASGSYLVDDVNIQSRPRVRA